MQQTNKEYSCRRCKKTTKLNVVYEGGATTICPLCRDRWTYNPKKDVVKIKKKTNKKKETKNIIHGEEE